MNELTIFNSDIIPVYVTSTGEKVVLSRELCEGLKIAERYSKWFDRMAGYGFVEGVDYTPYQMVHPQNGQVIENHQLKLDMAKHIAMIQRTPEGKVIRDKLIALETNVAELSPELRLLINMEVQQKQQAKALEATNRRLDSIGDVITLSPTAWREDAKRLISKVAQKRGGAYQETNAEIFHLVDERGGVSLETRLNNRRRRMADEGVCKSKRDKLSKVDVIAEDKKLVEIYLAVVKDLAIKERVEL